MLKKILLLICLLFMPLASMANTPTPTLTMTWTPVPNSPVSPYLQQLGTSTANLRQRSADYIYDAGIGDNGKVGPHVLKPVTGTLGVPYGAWIKEVWTGPTESCFAHEYGDGYCEISLGTPEYPSVFTTNPGGHINVDDLNNCGLSFGFYCNQCGGGGWKIQGLNKDTGVRLLNDMPIVLTVAGARITQGKMRWIVDYVLPASPMVIQQGTLTPTPGT